MYHQVPEFYGGVSERVSNILDVIGFSKGDRDRKVRCAIGSEFFRNIHNVVSTNRFVSFVFGSRGEGSTGPGLHSDQDRLYHDTARKIVTELSYCDRSKVNLLMVQDQHNHPGYVKLQLIVIDFFQDDLPFVQTEDYQDDHFRLDSYGRSVMSNKILEYARYDSTITGPAFHQTGEREEFEYDVVYAFRCTEWPFEAHEWFQRRRRHGWPNERQIQYSWREGCFATAVGHPKSSEKDLEWRLSFSLTERRLTRSFEETVMKVYILLKMVNKTYITPVLGKAFSSYHCKVCMLWMRENTPPELWQIENILYCLTRCINQLYEWASMGYCPDYFILTNNIYDRNIFGKAQLNLIRILGGLLSQDCRFLLGLKCCNLGQLLWYDCNTLGIIHIPTNASQYLELVLDYVSCLKSAAVYRSNMLRHVPQEYNILSDCIRIVMDALQVRPNTLLAYEHHILMTLLARMGFYLTSVCQTYAHSLVLEQRDYLVALASRCLSRGINSDATSVRLKLCGLGIMLGDWDLTEICLQHILDHRMGYMFSFKLDNMYFLNCNGNFRIHKSDMEEYSTEELLQNEMSYSVVYLPSETSITPAALRMEMFRSIGTPPTLRNKVEHFWYDWAVVDSLMCLYFFQYLNFFRPGKRRHQQAAMDNMIHVMRTEPDMPNRDTELNLLGYCFIREVQFRNAFICFYKSLQIRPFHNAAKFYLGILFHLVLIARRRHGAD